MRNETGRAGWWKDKSSTLSSVRFQLSGQPFHPRPNNLQFSAVREVRCRRFLSDSLPFFGRSVVMLCREGVSRYTACTVACAPFLSLSVSVIFHVWLLKLRRNDKSKRQGLKWRANLPEQPRRMHPQIIRIALNGKETNHDHLVIALITTGMLHDRNC